MEQQPEVIREQIEQTRGSLNDKLETLENQVKQTIDTVTSTVEHTVESVTSTVENTVDAVRSQVEGVMEAVNTTVHNTMHTLKQTFDVPRHTRRHPHAMAGGAFALGVVAGWWMMRQRRPASPSRWRAAEQEPVHHNGPPAKGWFANVMTPLAEEMHRIKGIGIGFLFGLVRETLERSAPPSLAPRVREIVDDMTRRAGATVMPSPVLGSHQKGRFGASAQETNP